jgi:hypothetical protein
MTGKKQTHPKTVFAVINLASSETNQKNVIRYAAQLAKALNLSLVLHPESRFSSNEDFLHVKGMASKIRGVQVSVPEQQKPSLFNFLKSTHKVAMQEHAAFIVMGVENEDVASLGKDIWNTTKKTMIPTILLPHGIEFNQFKNITIAVDAEHKVQKMKVANMLAKTFKAKINIFKEDVDNDKRKQHLIEIGLGQIEKHLRNNGIPFTVTKARQTKNFPKHLCKFAAKKSDLLIIEVEEGKIDNVVKQNIEVLLTIDDYAKPIPVMLTKTKMYGKLQNFHR